MEEAAAMYRREEKEDSVSPPHSENVGALLGTAYLTLCPVQPVEQSGLRRKLGYEKIVNEFRKCYLQKYVSQNTKKNVFR